MSTSTAPRQPLTPATLYTAVADWARTDGLTWLYVLKALTAAFLALGIAMKLDLPQPRTAMTTVFILMTQQSGRVLAKSFYRICGTLVGLVVMLVLISLFSQQPELFITSTAIWVGICTAGSARNRNFRSYGFVLAGYTAALIGIPASQNPDGAYMSALTRVAEITLGIICSGAVSALIFPQSAGDQMRNTVRVRFSAFVDYVAAALSGQVDRAHIEATNARFVADIVGFENTRSVAVFEGPEARMRSGRLSRLNSEFMTASTRFHALHQLMNRLHDASAARVIEALQPYFSEIAPLLNKSGQPILSAADAAHATAQLEAYKATLPQRVRATRAGLAAEDDTPLLDFDTAAELLYRFVDDLHAYTATYASLAVDNHERERWIERYTPKTNALAAAIGGLRATFVVMLLGAVWIATAWPSGVSLVLTGAATCALASSSPFPARMAFHMAIGTALAGLVGLVLTFGVYPHIDGFPLLCVVLTPCLALGVFMTTRAKLVGYGFGYCVFFCTLAGPDNLFHYDPTAFMNDAIALVLSMLVTAVACATILPPSIPWMRNRLLIDLRRQVVSACHARLTRLRSRFESGTRDLLFQLNALAATEPEFQRNALRWMFAVLETGNAVLDLRREIATLPANARYASTMPWRVAETRARRAVAALFERPDERRMDAALAATTDAIAAVQQVLTTFAPPREERHQLQRILSHLHFIRTALLDPQSPLETLVGTRTDASQGVRHAT
ncbi:FUSC family protein [Paraburkholderia sp. DHOC27]|uniref:FUSC family protein n=1 Tax=Paraburkholderia sp. DHOC27 TaxID=2303330 RepID=UPI000E3D132B|nr:FUSC family protein [Paraburkholderia sp. DHOC27]RFU46573.1 FUSC family protein [Paraburkholderia sp. DHOC27]